MGARRRAGLAALTLAVVAVAAGCTGSDEDDVPRAPLRTDTVVTEEPSPETTALPDLGDVCEAAGLDAVAELVPGGVSEYEAETAPPSADPADADEVIGTCTTDNGEPTTLSQTLVVRVTSGTYLLPDTPQESVRAVCDDVGPVEQASPQEATCSGVDELDGDRAEAHAATGRTLVSAELTNQLGTGVTEDQLDQLRRLVAGLVAQL